MSEEIKEDIKLMNKHKIQQSRGLFKIKKNCKFCDSKNLFVTLNNGNKCTKCKKYQ